VEHDLGVIAGLGREALGQDVLGLLGLATPPKLFSKRDPAADATAMIAITPAIQPSSTIRRWS
jgi:hypothetical protein